MLIGILAWLHAIGGGCITDNLSLRNSSHSRLLTGGLCRVALNETKGNATGLCNVNHVGDDRQRVYHKVHFILLYVHQILGVPENSEAGDVSGAVSVVLVHQSSTYKRSAKLSYSFSRRIHPKLNLHDH